MPENYITIPTEGGAVNVSEDVLAAVAAAAIGEVEGVAGFSSTAGPDLGELLGKKAQTRGVRVSFENGIVVVDASILVTYGTSVVGIGESAQKAAAAAISDMTGLESVVNVRVTGISFDNK